MYTTNKDRIDRVVKNELCTGCGTCIGVCPSKAIVLERSVKKGIYLPTIDSEKCTSCKICLKVCPGENVDFDNIFKSVFNNEQNQKKDIFIGSYLDCFVSYSLNPYILENSSSGGLITSLLLFALEQKIIDGALVTQMSPENPLDSQSFIARTPDEILTSSKSKYCPVATNICLKEIIEKPGKYAVVGLPCHIQGIRKAELVNPKLKQRIVLHFGIFCSHTVDFHGTETLLSKNKIPKDSIIKFSYRTKGWPGGISIKLKNGMERFIPHGQYWAPLFGRFFFTPIRCTLCCDGLAEMADISFGDAWLPEFKHEKKGKSILIARTQFGYNLLYSAYKNKKIQITSVPPIKIFQSQRDQILFKNKNITARQKIYTFLGHKVPNYGNKTYISPNFWDYIIALIPYLNIKISNFSLGKYFLIKCPIIFLSYTGNIIQKMYNKSYGEYNSMKFEPLSKIPPKIHIVNSYSPNFGDLAIISTTITTLKEAISGCDITVATTSPHLTQKYIKNASFVRSLGSRSSYISLQALNFVLFLRNATWLYFSNKGINLFFLANKKTRQALYEYKDADLILSCGGGYLNDNAGPAFLGCLLDVYLANIIDKPVIYYAQSIGPFNNNYLKKAASFVLNHSNQIILRDEISKQFLDELQLKKPSVTVTADIAMLLPNASKEKTKKMLAIEGIDLSCPLITITVKPWSFPGASDPNAKKQKYLESLIKLSEYIIKNYGANVLFIPMDMHEKESPSKKTAKKELITLYKKFAKRSNLVTYSSTIYSGELDLINRILYNVKDHTKIKMLTGDYSSAEIKSIISFSKIHIATRMHSSIFAVANLIPIIGIAYEPKMDSFMKTLNQTQFLTDIAAVDASKLENMFNVLWKNRDVSVETVSKNVKILKEKAAMNTSIIKNAFEEF